jgi:subtilisin family serine protease
MTGDMPPMKPKPADNQNKIMTPMKPDMPSMPEMTNTPDMPDKPDVPCIELHDRAFDGDIETKGTASTQANALSALRKLRESGELRRLQSLEGAGSLDGNSNFCPSGLPKFFCVPFDDPLPLLGRPRATADTKALDAWEKGWTGKGVKIGIVDIFKPTENAASDPSKRSHGYFTRGVALQIAPEAESFAYEASGNGSLHARLRTQYDRAESDGAFILNTSLGIDYFRSEDPINADGVKREIQAGVARLMRDANYLKIIGGSAKATTYDPKMLFVFSAGNSAKKCEKLLNSRHLDVCTLRGAALLKLRETDVEAGDRTIFVGSLRDDANLSEGKSATDFMADYSFHAGKLKYDFLTAHDDVWNTNSSGTSYAAPRVAGAAALVRHKFPNLNGPQLKQVLLHSADDLGADGPDEIYGYGALDVLGALSPMLDENGKLTK